MAGELTPEEIAQSQQNMAAEAAGGGIGAGMRNRFATILAGRQAAAQGFSNPGIGNSNGLLSVDDDLGVPVEAAIPSRTAQQNEAAALRQQASNAMTDLPPTQAWAERSGDAQASPANVLQEGFRRLHNQEQGSLNIALDNAKTRAAEATQDERVNIGILTTRADTLTQAIDSTQEEINAALTDRQNALNSLGDTSQNPALVAAIGDDATRQAITSYAELKDGKDGYLADIQAYANQQRQEAAQSTGDTTYITTSTAGKAEPNPSKEMEEKAREAQEKLMRLKMAEKHLADSDLLKDGALGMTGTDGKFAAFDSDGVPTLTAVMKSITDFETVDNKLATLSNQKSKAAEQLAETYDELATNQNSIRAVEAEFVAPAQNRIDDSKERFNDQLARIESSAARTNDLNDTFNLLETQINSNKENPLSSAENDAELALKNARDEVLIAGGNGEDLLNLARQDENLRKFTPSQPQFSSELSIYVTLKKVNGEVVAEMRDNDAYNKGKTVSLENGLDLGGLDTDKRIVIAVDESMRGEGKIAVIGKEGQNIDFLAHSRDTGHKRNDYLNPNEHIDLRGGARGVGSELEMAGLQSQASERQGILTKQMQDMQSLAKTMEIEVGGGLKRQKGESVSHHHGELMAALKANKVTLPAGISGGTDTNYADLGDIIAGTGTDGRQKENGEGLAT